ISQPESMPTVAIYHPEAPGLFESSSAYEKWYRRYRSKHKVLSTKSEDASSTVGLLLMRPQVISKTTRHYDTLIKAIEDEGLGVVPAIATLMDNREAVNKFFVDTPKDQRPKATVSQIVSLTGFSFVGGPAMNDS